MSQRALTLALLAATIACDAPTPTQHPTQTSPQPTEAQPGQPTQTDVTQPARPSAVAQPPRSTEPDPAIAALTWQQRTAGAIGDLQEKDPERYKKLSRLQPNRTVGTEKQYTQAIAQDPRAAPVFIKRLLNGSDSIAVRLALVDALPSTGGDWQEAAAALVAIDASPRVRKQLVETMRYVSPPHDIAGLRHGFQDEDPDVRAAAARTVGFARDGIGLFQEVVSMTFDDDWDIRAAAAQSLGKFQHEAGWPQLLRMLSDPRPEVRLQVLISLEHLDPEATRQLPELDKLASDRQNPRVASLARRLKAGPAKAPAGKPAKKPVTAAKKPAAKPAP